MFDTELVCQLCKAPVQEGIFCRSCKPTSCPVCSERVNPDSHGYQCEPGCFDVQDYIREQLSSTIRGTVEDRVRHLGRRVEIIIPDSEKITQVVGSVEELDSGEGQLAGIHFTNEKEQVLSEGFRQPFDLAISDRHKQVEQQYRGSIRFNAVFGWVHRPKYSPPEWMGEPVFFSIPFSKARISSYRYLNFITPADQRDDDDPLQISVDTYETKLTFSPSEFLQVVKQKEKPFSYEKLAQSQFRTELTIGSEATGQANK